MKINRKMKSLAPYLLPENLNEENKVSLFVRYIDIETGKYETRIVNKNK